MRLVCQEAPYDTRAGISIRSDGSFGLVCSLRGDMFDAGQHTSRNAWNEDVAPLGSELMAVEGIPHWLTYVEAGEHMSIVS
jgi:hypothetical protein